MKRSIFLNEEQIINLLKYEGYTVEDSLKLASEIGEGPAEKSDDPIKYAKWSKDQLYGLLGEAAAKRFMDSVEPTVHDKVVGLPFPEVPILQGDQVYAWKPDDAARKGRNKLLFAIFFILIVGLIGTFFVVK